MFFPTTVRLDFDASGTDRCCSRSGRCLPLAIRSWFVWWRARSPWPKLLSLVRLLSPSATQEQPRRIGLGILITREDIAARVVFATHELLQGTPGVRVWNGPPKRIRFVRCQDPGGISIFIDGVRQISNASSGDRDPPGFAGIPRRASTSSREDEPEIEILSRINPSDVEMIEVYRGASEIPGVFHWNGCAVVAIWTRWNR